MGEHRKLLFLDVDGVLNHPTFGGPDGLPMIDPGNARAFNRLAREASPSVVISSSWGSAIHGGFMSPEGFGMLLLTHRIRCRVIGVTPRRSGLKTQSGEIAAWLAQNGGAANYVVLDDDDDGISGNHPFVQTDGRIGLTEADADRAIAILKGEIIHG